MHLLKGCEYMAEYRVTLGVDIDIGDVQGQINNIKPNPIKVDIDMGHINSQIGQIKSQIKSLDGLKINLGTTGTVGAGGKGKGGGKSSGVSGEVNELALAYDRLKNISKNINSIKIKGGGLNASKDLQQIKILEKQLKSFEAQYAKTEARIKENGDLSPVQWQKFDLQVENTNTKLEQLKGKLADAKTQLGQKIKFELETDNFDNQISKIETGINKLKKVPEPLQKGLNSLKTLKGDMDKYAASGDTENLIKTYDKYQKVLKRANNQLNINTREEREAAAALRAKEKEVKDLQRAKEKAAREAAKAAKIEEKAAKEAAKAKEKAAKAEEKAAKKAAKKAEQEKAANEANTFTGKLRQQLSRYASYLSVASLFMYTVQGLKDMFNQVVAIDSAMTELKKVTNETDDSYNTFLSNAASRAKKIGTTIDGLVASTADFARLGYDFEQAAGLAEVANIYTVVGDEIDGVEGATQSLVSTLAAFKHEMGDMSDTDFAMSIVDKFNEVSNNFAISSGGIGEALQRSASSLAAANNTLDESIALITAANTVVQNPEKVGNAFKTISMRIRGAKTELEEAGESTEGMAESTASLREEILALSGVDIMENDNTFKSTYEIMDELSKKWEGLSDIAQASITELIAGKHQGNVMSSLMANFDIARDALETSQNSAGSAMAEHAKWSDSLEARLNSLKASWQSLSLSFLKSDFLKGGISSITGLVDALDSLVNKFGTLPTLIGLFSGARSLIDNKGFFSLLNKDIEGSIKELGFFRAAFQNILIGNKSIPELVAPLVKSFGEIKGAFSEGATEKGFAGFIGGLKSIGGLLRDKTLENLASSLAKVTEPFKEIAGAFSEGATEKGFAGFIGGLKSIGGLLRDKMFSGDREPGGDSSGWILNGFKLSNEDLARIQSYNDMISQTGNAHDAFKVSMEGASDELKNFVGGFEGGVVPLENLKAAEGGVKKLTGSMIGAKVAAAGLKIAFAAMNAALSMGISFLVSSAIKAFDEWHVSASELAEKVDEITTKYKDQHSELMKLKNDYDTSNEDSLISKYEELSKGVDAFGENLSLTADEYSEYQNIVSKIADQIPSLVSGYDSQGNAILSCANNIEQLVAAYEDLIHAQNLEVLSNAGNIENDFANTIEKQSGTHWWTNGHGLWKGFDFLKLANYELKDDTASVLSSLLDAKEDKDKILSELRKEDSSTYSAAEIRTALKGVGVDIKWYESDQDVYDKLEETLKTDPQKIKTIVENHYSQYTDEAEQQKAIARAKLSEAFDISEALSGLNYSNISEDLQSIAYQTVNSLDYDFFSKLKEQNMSVEQWTTNMLNQLSNLKENSVDSIETAFDLKTKFNGNEISYGEYVKSLEGVGDLVNGLVRNGDLGEEVGKQIKLSLGMDEDGIVKGYKTLTNSLKDIGLAESEAQSLLDSLSSKELSVLTKIIPNIDANKTREQIEAAIEREMILSGLIFDLDIEAEISGIESLNTALKESVTASGLSSESISALKSRYSDLEKQGWDLTTMFEETSHGIHVNRKEISKFENELSKQKLKEVNSDLARMKSEYDKLGKAIKTATGSEKASLFSQRQDLAKKIADAATLASQYQGLTSAYNQWLAAEEAGNERDMYENIIGGFDTVKDELSRGWIDDSTIAFLEMLTGKTDLASKSGKQLKEIYDGLGKTIENTNYSVKDFFTTDKDGNSTSKGVYNFLDAVGQLEEEKFGGKDIVKRNSEGNIIGFDFSLAAKKDKDGNIIKNGDQVIAEALGISEELVQIMARASDDAGFVVSMDGTYKQLAELQNEARAAVDVINGLFNTNYKFDFNTSSISNLESQLKGAINILNKTNKSGKKIFWNDDGTFNFDAEGATEAMTIVSTLQAKLDTLKQGQYGIGLTVEDKKFEEPLEKMQEYGRTVAELNQLKLNPVTNVAEIEKLEGDLNSIAQELIDLSKNSNIDIGIDADDKVEDVKKKLESGKIKIPTTLDIQANMDKNISDLKDIMLLTSGYLTSEQEQEILIRLGLRIEAKDPDTSGAQEAIDGAVDEVSEAANTAETEPIELIQSIEVNPELKQQSLGDKIKNFFKNPFKKDDKNKSPLEPAEVKQDVKIEAGEVKTEGLKDDVKDDVKSSLGEIDADVKVNANVNTSGSKTTNTDNIKDFAEAAKELDDVDSKNVDVSANFNGNAVNVTKEKADNIKYFAEAVKELDGIESKYVDVSANMHGNAGNVVTQEKANNIKQFAEAAKALKDVESKYVDVSATFNGNADEVTQEKANNVKFFAGAAKALNDVESKYVGVTATFNGNADTVTKDRANNIKNFAGAAKELKDAESKSVSITANLDGNASEISEEKLNNVKNFAATAKELQDTGNIEYSVQVDITGNFNDGATFEELTQFAKDAQALQGIKKSTVTITANISGDFSEKSNDYFEKLKIFAEGASGLKDAESKNISITANADGNVFTDSNFVFDNLTAFAEGASGLKDAESKTVEITANILGNLNAENISILKEFVSVIASLPTAPATVGVQASVDTENINNAMSLLETIANSGLFKDYTATVTVTAVPEEANLGNQFTGDGKATMEPDKTDFGSIFTGTGIAIMEPDKTDFGHIFTGSGTVNMSYSLAGLGAAGGGGLADGVSSGLGGSSGAATLVNGTAHVNGTAFADGTTKSGRAFRLGDWRTKESGVALMGELGRELIVRDGRFFTVGDNGAGFYPYKKGDIIFNHRQTEELFKNGHVISGGGRGRTFASGTAMSSGTAFNGGSSGNNGGWNPWDEPFYKSGSSEPSGGGGGGGDDSEENKNEVFDWIEKLLERFDRAIDMLDKAANNIYKSFDKRNTSLSDEIAKVTEQISNQQKAYERYIAEAETVGNDIGFDIGDDFRDKIRKGDFSIDVLNSDSDKKLIEYIGYFEEWYEKALDAQEAIQELEETLSSLYALRVENVATKFEGILGVIEHEKNILEEYINQSEAQAWLVSSKYYDALASNERDTIAELQNQKAEMLIAFEEAMDSGTIDEGSESWYEMVASIDEVTLAIKESETALLEYEQTIQQLDWEIFDLLQDKISSVNDETEFLIELLSNKKLYGDDGQLTNEGAATMGLHGVAYNTYMHQADLVAEEIAKLKKELEEDPFDTELEERYREMIALQQEYILSAESQKNAIKDLVEEGIQLELDALDERIEKYNEALDSQKDLYEYQKKVSEQTSEIASLQKQMAAYEGDNSEEAKAKLQELKVSLQEAEADLEETEYDKYISDTQQMLDDVALEYEELLNTRLDNIDYLIEQMIDEINGDSSVISDTIREAANSVGYTLTDSMKAIWDEDALSTKNVITTYGDKFVNAQTTTNNALNAINTNLQNMINKLDKKATSNTKSASTSSVAKSSNTKTTTTKTTTKKSSGGDGTPKIGDRVKYVSGQYYYDSQGKKPLGSHKQGEYVYITNINTRDWATHGYHISTGNKLGKGDLGWLKLNQISGYATGKKSFANDEVAWTQEDGKEFIVRPSDGAILTPIAKGDSILTSASSKNIWDFANSPAEFIKDNLNIGSNSAPNNSNSKNNYTQYLDKVVFNLPNVKNYEQFLSAMQKDKNFERLIQSMTIDQISGKSSLGKGKSIR